MVSLINTALLRVHATVTAVRDRFMEERGQDFIEYALLGGVIGIAFVAAAIALPLSGAFDDMMTAISNCIDFNGTSCP